MPPLDSDRREGSTFAMNSPSGIDANLGSGENNSRNRASNSSSNCSSSNVGGEGASLHRAGAAPGKRMRLFVAGDHAGTSLVVPAGFVASAQVRCLVKVC